jgi:hypothetical protein
MPRGVKIGRGVLLKELKRALDEVDSVKVELRKAKQRVSTVLRKLDVHVLTHRARRKGA